MIDYDEATARYNALLAELTTASAKAAENPDDSELAAAAQDIYDLAQAAYADVLAGYGADGAIGSSATPAASEQQNAADDTSAPAEAISQVQSGGDVYLAMTPVSMTPVSVAPISMPPVSMAVGSEGVGSETNVADDGTDYDLGDFGTPATVAAPSFGQKVPEGVFILTRKPVATRFVPSETPIEELTPISRSILPKRAKGQKSALSRERNIAGSLPEWSPTPPGEVLMVKRVGTTNN